MTFTITRFVSLGLSAGASKTSLRFFSSTSPRCINIHPFSRPIRTSPRRLYSTTTVRTAKAVGSAVAIAVIAGGASLFFALARSRDTGTPNPTEEAVVEVVPTAPQTGSEPTRNFTKALEDLQAEFPESSIVSTDPGELYAYAQSAYSQFVGQFTIQSSSSFRP
jgi:D-lactate dehydrogenase (cytochrome)